MVCVLPCFYHFKCAVYTSLYFTFVTWYCDLHVCPYCLMFVAITLFFNTYLLLLFILAVSGRSCVTRDRHCGSLLQLWRVVWDLSPPARDRTHTPCTRRGALNPWTTREVPVDIILIAKQYSSIIVYLMGKLWTSVEHLSFTFKFSDSHFFTLPLCHPLLLELMLYFIPIVPEILDVISFKPNSQVIK